MSNTSSLSLGTAKNFVVPTVSSSGTCTYTIEHQKEMIAHAVELAKEVAFRKFKLVTTSDLDMGHHGCVHLMKEAAGFVSEKEMQTDEANMYWQVVKADVARVFYSKRNHVTEAMKKRFFGKSLCGEDILLFTLLTYYVSLFVCFTALMSEGALPPKNDLLRLRNADIGVFRVFCESFLICVLGVERYKNNKRVRRVHEFADVTDEAFALLLIDNNYEYWKALYPLSTSQQKSQSSRLAKMHQHLFVDDKGTFKNNWTESGSAALNRYYDQVVDDRRVRSKVDEQFRTWAKAIYGQGQAQKTKNQESAATKKVAKAWPRTVKSTYTVGSLALSRSDKRHRERMAMLTKRLPKEVNVPVGRPSST